MPNFQIDFPDLLEEGQRQMEKDEQAEQDEPGMSQELDDFISSIKSENAPVGEEDKLQMEKISNILQGTDQRKL